MVETIAREELKRKIDTGEDFFLYEVLPPDNYRHSHLPGARNMPPDKVIETALAEVADKAAEIVVYCSKPS